MLTLSNAWKGATRLTRKAAPLIRLQRGAGDPLGLSGGGPSRHDGVSYRNLLSKLPDGSRGFDIRTHRPITGNWRLRFKNGEYSEGQRLSDKLVQVSNRDVEVRLWAPGIDAWDDLPEYLKGVVRKVSHDDKEVVLEVEDMNRVIHRKVPGIVGSSDAADGEVLPEGALGRASPIVGGDHRSNIGNTTASLINLSRFHNFSKAVPLGVDQNGKHYWRISNHKMEGVDEIWALDSGCGRAVQISSFTIEQNNSDGCIISHADGVTYYDYWYPAGVTSNKVETNGGTVTNEDKAADLDVTIYALFQGDDVADNAYNADEAGVDVEFPPYDGYQDDANISAVGIFVLGVYDDGGYIGSRGSTNALFTIAGPGGGGPLDATGLNSSTTYQNIGSKGNTKATVGEILRIFISGALTDLDNPVSGDGVLSYGSFVSDLEWTEDAEWNVDTVGEVADCDNTGRGPTATTDLTQSGVLIVGEQFKVGIVINEIDGTVQVGCGTSLGTIRSSAGLFEEIITCAGNTDFIIRATGETGCQIESVWVEGLNTGKIYQIFKRVSFTSDEVLPVLFGGRGMEYGPEIDGRSTVEGYSETHVDDDQSGALIENPAGLLEAICRNYVDRNSEHLAENDFAAHAKWDVTGDFDDTGGAALYEQNSHGTSTLKQTAANRAKPGKGNAKYRLKYKVTVTIAPDGDFALQLTSAFAESAVSLPFTDGIHPMTFVSSPGATAADFVIQASETTATQGKFRINIIYLESDDIDLDSLNVLSKERSSWKLAPAITKQMSTADIVGEIMRQSGSYAWHQPGGTLKAIALQNTYSSEDVVIDLARAARINFEMSPMDWLMTRVKVLYAFDGERYLGQTDFAEDTAQQTYYSVEQGATTKYVEGGWIPTEAEAILFRDWYLPMWKQQHVLGTIGLPLEYVHADAGDVVRFTNAPYKVCNEDITVNHVRSGQTIYKYFLVYKVIPMVTGSIIYCIQLHNLTE